VLFVVQKRHRAAVFAAAGLSYSAVGCATFPLMAFNTVSFLSDDLGAGGFIIIIIIILFYPSAPIHLYPYNWLG
jgi:hypothetical protein